ncbi:MAG: DUF488 family protein [bacterium]
MSTRRADGSSIPRNREAQTLREEHRAELFAAGSVDAANRTIKNHGQKFTLRLLKHLAASQPVTLLCHCAEDQAHCHRHVLRQVILSKRV